MSMRQWSNKIAKYKMSQDFSFLVGQFSKFNSFETTEANILKLYNYTPTHKSGWYTGSPCLSETFVTNISAFSRGINFIFDMQLNIDELYGVSDYCVYQTPSSCWMGNFCVYIHLVRIFSEWGYTKCTCATSCCYCISSLYGTVMNDII